MLPPTDRPDNAKTFKSDSKKIQAVSCSSEVLHRLTNNRITWDFIVEEVPWWNVFFERIVREN